MQEIILSTNLCACYNFFYDLIFLSVNIYQLWYISTLLHDEFDLTLGRSS